MRAKAIPAILSALLLLLAFGAQAAVDSKGTDFFVAFQPNFNRGNLSLFITSEQDTQGLVEISGLNFQRAFTVQANQVTTVALPVQAQRVLSNRVTNLGVKITAQSEVTVYGLNQLRFTTDAFLALPGDALGLEYRAMSFPGPAFFQHLPSQITIVGAFDNTQVTIVPSDTARGRPAGVPFTITLNSAETFHLEAPFFIPRRGFNTSDLTGTRITATAPIAVMSGGECAFVPRNVRSCDHITEMMPPVAAWGESFLTVPLATRLNGDLFRILASQNSTEVRINGAPIATLNAGKFLDRILTAPSQIEASAPVLVAQYATGQNFDGVISDPFMMLVPPTEQFLSQYTFSTPAAGFNRNFVNVVAPTAEFGTLTLDGIPIDPSLFTPIGTGGFSGAQIPVTLGSHTLSGGAPFGIYSYGFAAADSYGYPGGMAFDFINPAGDSFAPNLRLTPLDDTIFGTATDSEDINANGVLDPGEDLNGNGMIGRRTEDLNSNGILDAGEDTNNNGILDRDTGIFRVELDPGSTNLQLDVPAFVPGALRVDFTITLIDRNQPGEGVLRIVDGAGNTIEAPINLSLVPTLSDVRVIDTLSTDNIELDPASFSRPPHSITTVDGQTVIEWRFDRISVDQIEDIDFDVILRNPIPGEQRLVSHKLELIYNDVNGNEVRTELGEQFVNVASSIFQVGVSINRSNYTANENVVIVTQLANLSDAPTNATVRLSIKDAQGVLVSALGVTSVSLAANETQQLVGTDFFTGALLEGQYEVHAEVLDALGQPLALAVVPFLVITPSAQKLSAGISTDKLEYAPLEIVSIQNQIINQTPNAILNDLTAVTTLFDPSNQVFFTDSTALPQLLPNALQDVDLAVPLGRALPGSYRIVLVVKDADGVERALAETSIRVQSTAETGSGLTGSLAIVPTPVLKTEFVTLTADVENLGNSNVQNLPLTLSIVDPASQQVIAQWSETVADLATLGRHVFDRQWQALGVIGSTFIAVLQADIGGETRLLAQNIFVIGSKIDSQFAQGPRGRLLVLLDPERCDGVTRIDLQADFSSSLGTNATVLVELFGPHDSLVDSETAILASFVGPINVSVVGGQADLAITAFDSRGLSVSFAQASSEDDGELEDKFRVVAKVQSDGNVLRLESDPIHAKCSLANGDVQGDFVIAGVTVRQEDKDDDDDHHHKHHHGSPDLPTLTQQRDFLETLLQREAWSYTLVTNEKAFAHELRSGGYAVYALLSEKIKLDEDLQKELREAVFRGEGLVVAGGHDRRNHKLEDALGIKTTGKNTKATGLELLASDLHTEGSANFATQDKRLSAMAKGAEVIGRFTGLDSNRHHHDDDDEDDDDKQHKANKDKAKENDHHKHDHDDDNDGGDKDEEDDHRLSDIAVTTFNYGDGRSVYNGFDLLAEATLAGDGSLFATLLTQALGHVHPDLLTPRAGGVVPLRLTLTNNGTPSPGRAVISLPPGSEVVDPSIATMDIAGSLVWPFTLATGETTMLDVWVRLPADAVPVTFDVLIQVGQAPNFIDHNVVMLTITPVAIPTIGDIIDAIDAIPDPDKHIKKAKKSLLKAQKELGKGDIDDAIEALLKATGRLMDSMHVEAVNIRKQIGQLIWQQARLL